MWVGLLVTKSVARVILNDFRQVISKVSSEKAKPLLLVSLEASWGNLEPPVSILTAPRLPGCEAAQTSPSGETPWSSEAKWREMLGQLPAFIHIHTQHTHTHTTQSFSPSHCLHAITKATGATSTQQRVPLVDITRANEMIAVDAEPWSFGVICYVQ